MKVGDAPKPMPVAVLEAKKEGEDPLKGMQQARGYADTLRFDVKYVFSTNGHKYGEYNRFTELINGPSRFSDFLSHSDLTARYCTNATSRAIIPVDRSVKPDTVNLLSTARPSRHGQLGRLVA